MSVTFRVLPQPGSVGALKNQLTTKNAQITSLRQQVLQLRSQLATFTTGASMLAAPQPTFGYSQPYAPAFGQSQFSGWMNLLGRPYAASPVQQCAPVTQSSWFSRLF